MTIINKNIFIKILVVLGLLVSFSAGPANGASVEFEISADRNVLAIGQGLQLQLKFEGTRSIPTPKLGDIEGFRSRYIGPSTSMSIVNTRVTSSVTHIYSLIPLKTGKFNIGPFTFDHKGDTYRSNSLGIEVVDSHDTRRRSRGDTGSGQLINDRISLVMEAGRSKAYLNEMIPLTIKLYIKSLSVRDIEYPVFEHDGLSVGEFDKPLQYQEQKGGLTHDVIEFRTMIFATRSGSLNIGPARIKSNIMIQNKRRRSSSAFDGFFNGAPFGNTFGYESTLLNCYQNRSP